jgi:hypothetical protein
LAQPQAGQAGQPAAQPGTGYPAQPGAGPSGATSSISIKGILIAAAAIVVVVVAVVAAFLLLRPNPPQQTAAQQSPPTANPTPGAGAPAGGAESSTVWSGEYQVTAQEATSPCTGEVPGTLSVSATATAIVVVMGPVTWHGTMTATGSFAAKAADKSFGFEGNFARINDVATLNGKIFGTDPTGLNADCIHTFTATRRS